MRVASLLAIATLCAARPAEAAGAVRLALSGITTPQAAGSVSSVRVEAKTNSGATATSYLGTVHFSSADAQAVLPADYTFTAADQGIHVFTNAVTLKTAGTQSVTATDTASVTITGSQTGITVTALAASRFVLSGFAVPTTAGVATSLTIEARDLYGNRSPGYRGSVHITSTDPAAVLPADYAFTAADAGIHTFANGVTFKTSQTQIVSATDAANSSITGSLGAFVHAGPAVTFFVNSNPAKWTVNIPLGTRVEARDVYGNVAGDYRGTVHLTSTDPLAVLPSDYTFTPTDSGAHTFTVTFGTVGTQTYTVSDATTSTIAGNSAGIQIVTNDAVKFDLWIGWPAFPPPNELTAGSAQSVMVWAKDAAGNIAKGYTGTIHFTSTDPQASVPSDYQFTSGSACNGGTCDNGQHLFSLSLTLRSSRCFDSDICWMMSSWTQTVTATDNSSSVPTGSSSIRVVPATSARIAIFGFAIDSGGSTTAGWEILRRYRLRMHTGTERRTIPGS